MACKFERSYTHTGTYVAINQDGEALDPDFVVIHGLSGYTYKEHVTKETVAQAVVAMRLTQDLEEEGGDAFNELLEAEDLELLAEHEAVGSNAMGQFGGQMRDLAQGPLSIITASLKVDYLCYSSSPAHTLRKKTTYYHTFIRINHTFFRMFYTFILDK
jgi:hypothetical protein